MIILGLGSNLGNSHAYIEKAIEHLSNLLVDNVKRSSVYESEPMLPENAPDDWNMSFLNMAISGDLKKNFSPEEVLEIVKSIEAKIGRKEAARWAPREIDIDILAWDDKVINMENLEVPHYGLTERAFAITPLADLAPDWLHPKTGIKASEYAKQFKI